MRHLTYEEWQVLEEFTYKIAKAKFYKADEVALARSLLIVALTGVTKWRYDEHWHAFVFRWVFRVNGTKADLNQIITAEILVDANMTTMQFAETLERQALNEWVRFRYKGPRE